MNQRLIFKVNIFFFFQEEDVDYLCKLARLINCIGLQLALSWTKYLIESIITMFFPPNVTLSFFFRRLKKAGDNDSASAVMQLLESKIPLCFRFLSHSDDDVSATVMDFAREYIQV